MTQLSALRGRRCATVAYGRAATSVRVAIGLDQHDRYGLSTTSFL